MMVGTKAIATLSTGYLNALEYAKNRVQGADLLQMTDKTAPRVTITHHPDVRRSLMLQKSYAEGLRALVVYTATWQDQVAHRRGGRRRPTAAKLAERVNDLLLPLVKGCRLGAGVRAARPRVAADLRRLRLPAGLPAGAVRPRRQDRHPVRGHHRDPEPRPVLPQDREGQRPGADGGRRRDPGSSSRPRPATASSRRSGSRSARRSPTCRRMLGDDDRLARRGPGRRRRARSTRSAWPAAGSCSPSATWSSAGCCQRQAEVALQALAGEVSAGRQGVLRGQGRRGPVLRPRGAAADRRATAGSSSNHARRDGPPGRGLLIEFPR